MKKFLLTTSAFILTAGMASAQVSSSNPSADANGDATAESRNSGTQKDKGNAEVSLKSVAIVDEDDPTARAEAYVNGVNDAYAETDASGAPNVAKAWIEQSTSNDNKSVQFQLGNDNEAINMQVGKANDSAMVQNGNNNVALVSSDGDRNEAAIAQSGKNNSGAVVQEGNNNAGVSAVVGMRNNALGLQDGGRNVLAMVQDGNDNTIAVWQEGDRNTAVSVQEGNNNDSFITQGGDATMFSAMAINSRSFSGDIGSGAVIAGSGMGFPTTNSNSAASLQLGNNNTSGIMQAGLRNEAINYQNSRP